jgi:hypothetical protein
MCVVHVPISSHLILIRNQENYSHIESQSEYGGDPLVSMSVMTLNMLGDISPSAL